MEDTAANLSGNMSNRDFKADDNAILLPTMNIEDFYNGSTLFFDRVQKALDDFTIGGYSYANEQIRAQAGGGFKDGSMNAPGSNMGSGSSFAGYAGLQMDKTKSLLKYTAKNSSGWANKATALKAAKAVSKVGKTFGIIGAAATAFEGYYDGNGLTAGDYTKIGIGLLTTFTPVGWVYGIADIGVGIFTGTTITDRIGNGIDTGFK